MPQARHREHIGRALEHLTFARKQPSQDARSRCWRGFAEAMAEDVWAGGVWSWAKVLGLRGGSGLGSVVTVRFEIAAWVGV
jgi:hypothetical protein